MADIQDGGDDRVLVDTGQCRVERHPEHGVLIWGSLVADVVDGEAVLVPVRPARGAPRQDDAR